MVFPRVATALLTVLALATAAASAGAAPSAPTGLRGFLLRADEPAQTSFPRTPAFAWKPVEGATGYEFQLSTSSAFRDNGIVWQCPSVKCPSLETPVAAPTLSLPWITGSPHALYARVRAVLRDKTRTEWSTAFGFDLVPPAPPTPLPSAPGMLRWTPVPGASGYQVWLIDARPSGVNGKAKVEKVYTNVLDEREFYTFHQATSWIGTVRWRVRALRNDWSDERVNGVPVTPNGAWSPIYVSTNPAATAGQIHLGSTISDVVGNGKSTDLAHRLMPAFTWTGNETLDGTRAELYRVYVFTDKQCLNRVFTGAIVGSPAYAPRPYGGLALPANVLEVPQVRNSYLNDLLPRSAELAGISYDGEPRVSNEAAAAAAPTLATAGGGQGATSLTTPTKDDLGAPVSLWDDDWPDGGYYWTVVPVGTQFTDAATLASTVAKGSTSVYVLGSPDFSKGDQVQLGAGGDIEILSVANVSGNAVVFTGATQNAHTPGEPIVKLGNAVYRDLELPQDVCAAGRVARFGVNSEPSLVAGDNPFASGLSPQGRLVSAVRTESFYKAPVVSWTPALGASVYQVQWSKSATPFDPVPGPGGANGIMTPGTSYVLPLTPGTWYYRVRGFDWSLRTGAQAMGWSDVARIVVQNASFKVVPTKAKRR